MLVFNKGPGIPSDFFAGICSILEKGDTKGSCVAGDAGE